jgi:hypothetical protein
MSTVGREAQICRYPEETDFVALALGASNCQASSFFLPKGPWPEYALALKLARGGW